MGKSILAKWFAEVLPKEVSLSRRSWNLRWPEEKEGCLQTRETSPKSEALSQSMASLRRCLVKGSVDAQR